MRDRQADRIKVLKVSATVCDSCQRHQSCLPYNFAQVDRKICQMLEKLTHCDKQVLKNNLKTN
ncbi:hypothetical protein [Thalassoporum mexicanum]|uniref:hypothetical protein n=1 Tax=Thalassoporum mexicanum TaxID=3457544 RepID=UPI0002F60827|nr:hypothetical protein [Pseudanabaena sp. PCC 7367]